MVASNKEQDGQTTDEIKAYAKILFWSSEHSLVRKTYEKLAAELQKDPDCDVR